jgi:hypothetical protein
VVVTNSDIRPDGLSRSKLEAEKKAHADFKRQKQMQEERELLKKKENDAKIVREKLDTIWVFVCSNCSAQDTPKRRLTSLLLRLQRRTLSLLLLPSPRRQQ